MSRHLRGPALDHCPQCDIEYGSVSQHWAMTHDCAYPPIPDLLAGFLLGDASLDDPNERDVLRIGTAKRAFAEWLYDDLDLLPTSLRVETFDDPNKQLGISSGRSPTGGMSSLPRLVRRWHDGSSVVGNITCAEATIVTQYSHNDGPHHRRLVVTFGEEGFQVVL